MKIKVVCLLFLAARGVLLLATDRPIAQQEFIDQEQESTRAGLIYEIKAKTDTLKIMLSQDWVDGTGAITLSNTGAYIFTDNIVCDIAITGTNVTLDLGGKSLFGTLSISGSTAIIKNGAIVVPPPVDADDALHAALTIGATATMVRVKECHIECLDSVQTMPGVDQLIAGRNAIEISGLVVDIQGCSIGAGTSVSTTTTSAPDGGTAIIIDGQANKVRILNCIMVAGDGGAAAIGDGGNGGHGVYVTDTASQLEIANCTIFQTGAGGAPDGNGGHGIVIDSGAADVAVYGCTIRNTGQGAAAGVGGKAIQDSVSTVGNYSTIYHNVAYNIANTLNFDLQGSGSELGIHSPIPPDNTLINLLGNIYFS